MKYFSLGPHAGVELFLDFITLFLFIFAKNHAKKKGKVKKKKKRSSIMVFSQIQKLKQLKKALKYVFFKYFYVILLTSYFFVGITNEKTKYIGITSIIYATTAIYYLTTSGINKPRKRKNILLFLETFNDVFVFANILFQLPLFSCPYADEESSFLGVERCYKVLNSHTEIDFFLHSNGS